MIDFYGISNCDTVRKARRWLEGHGVEYRFHDFRKEPPTREQVSRYAPVWMRHMSSTCFWSTPP